MAQVWRPAPSWIQRTQRAAAALFPRRRAWLWAGGLASTSTCSLAIIIALMVTYSVQVETAWSAFTGGLGLPAWRATISGTIGLVSSVLAYSKLITLNTTMLISAGLGTALVMVVSLLGRELAALLDTIEEQERQLQELRERLRGQCRKEIP